MFMMNLTILFVFFVLGFCFHDDTVKVLVYLFGNTVNSNLNYNLNMITRCGHHITRTWKARPLEPETYYDYFYGQGHLNDKRAWR